VVANEVEAVATNSGIAGVEGVSDDRVTVLPIVVVPAAERELAVSGPVNR